MPALSTTGLVLAYVALAVLLLSLHIFSNWNVWIKAGATIALGAFYFVTYTSVPALLGWPTPYDLPQKFKLIAVSIEEQKGVYLWGHDLKDGLQFGQPRAYAFPYSKKLHTKAEIAGAKIRRGGTVIGEIELVDAAGGINRTDQERTNLSSTNLDVDFIDAPEELIPEKK